MSYLDQITDVFAEFIVVSDDVQDQTVMRIEDLGKALELLGLPNDEKSVITYALKLDARNTGFVEFERFVEVITEALDTEVQRAPSLQRDLDERLNAKEGTSAVSQSLDASTATKSSQSDSDEGAGFVVDDDDSEGYVPSDQDAAAPDSDSEGGGFFQEDDSEFIPEESLPNVPVVEREGEGADARLKSVKEAFLLFTNGEDRPITLSDLRRIAHDVKDNASDEQLQDMLALSSNKNFVNLSSFDSIMKQANAM
ncbi:EF-hand superfamily Ca2+modulated protein [Sugiyamaella lignohabitans]|uniref:EF-hand superfamily Ca2+modulated protein n=1 Tax=Sugiyamaella lignohabitans TaxID=796027 RepID=A0A167DLE1_9ASCO|nr:EF-hand superfamily Ca2+modulated protein [Sugiyamaella lignohabitans]ANB13039.1 EF-hand superfamily Ca2+modulated protein [Sugiyamaella lignohabitans]